MSSLRPEVHSRLEISVGGVGKREAEEQLTAAHAAVVMQEDAIRRLERERQQAAERLSGSERKMSSMESERRQLEVRFSSQSSINNYYFRLQHKTVVKLFLIF